MKVTDTVTSPESTERKPLEASSASLSEALGTEVKEEAAETPAETTEEEPRSVQEEEKVEPGDDVEEKTANTSQIEEKEVDKDEDKVIFLITSILFLINNSSYVSL